MPPDRHIVVEVLPDGARNGVDPDVVAVPPSGILPDPARPQEMSPAELRQAEGDVIDDLFRSDQQSKQRVGTVVFERLQVRQFTDDGVPKRGEQGELVKGPLELRLRALRQSEIDQERRKCGRIWQIDEEGRRVNDIDPTEFSARLVARGLVLEDRQRYLEDKRMWQHFEVGGPIDLLDAWLTAGELNQAGAVVMQMSGMPLNAAIERFLQKQSSAGEAG